MTTKLLCSSDFGDLSDQQQMFLLRAAYGPTLCFRPRQTSWLAALMERGLLREHSQDDADFPLLYLTIVGHETVKLILAAENARRADECAAREHLRHPEAEQRAPTLGR